MTISVPLTERGFAGSMGFGQRPILLVIDIVKGFTDPTAPLGAQMDRQIAATNRLIAAARTAGAPTIFSTIRYDDPGLADAGIWSRKIKGLATLVAGLDGSEIDPRLDIDPTDGVLVKKYASCFFGTDLASRLIADGIDTLVVAGCTTSGCVRATVVDACQYGFRPVVVREAVFDRLEASHRQSLIDIEMKYGDVLGIDEAVAKIGETAGSRTREKVA